MEDELAQIDQLLSDYAEQNSRRARGGLFALSGFNFQLRVYLARAVENLVEADMADPANPAAEGPLLEAFSDFTEIDTNEDHVVCVQVKRTLSRATLASAGVEFAAIDAFFEEHGNRSLRESIRYECVGRFGEIDLSWDGISLPNKNAALQDRFGALRDSGRILPPRHIEEDPWLQLASVSFRWLNNPFEFARKALDLCLRRGIDPDGATHLREQIAELYFQNRRKTEQKFYPQRPQDFADVKNAGATRLVVGATPTIARLCSGEYMERDNLVEKICASLIDLRDRQRSQEGERVLHFFWIDGRSGSGKSVLLLEVMRTLVRQMESVLWLKDQSAALTDVLELYQSNVPSTPCPEFVFVDDFYDRQSQERVEIGEIESRICHARSPIDWPIVVTCGPPEFQTALEERIIGDGIRLVPWRIPKIAAVEANKLKKWFIEKTGHAAKAEAAFDQEEGLIISMAFEANHGDLKGFALRFKERLVASELDQALQMPLALNRLYIWPPARWLSDEQLGRMEILNQDFDFDFSILNSEANSAGYIKPNPPTFEQRDLPCSQRIACPKAVHRGPLQRVCVVARRRPPDRITPAKDIRRRP